MLECGSVNKPMRVLIACEYSAIVRDAFAARGHYTWSCDILPTEGDPRRHYQGDIFEFLKMEPLWDLMIAHPPCTYMTNSGVSWLHKDSTRWAKLDDAAAFFRLLLNAPIPRIAIENPIMHKYAKERIGGTKQSQVIQPWMFGHMEQKATCLWLKNLPLLQPTFFLRVFGKPVFEFVFFVGIERTFDCSRLINSLLAYEF